MGLPVNWLLDRINAYINTGRVKRSILVCKDDVIELVSAMRTRPRMYYATNGEAIGAFHMLSTTVIHGPFGPNKVSEYISRTTTTGSTARLAFYSQPLDISWFQGLCDITIEELGMPEKLDQ